MKQLFILILFSIFNVNLAQAERIITIAGDEWCPINCAENSSEQGFLIEVAEQALASMGYKVRYIELPWNRAVKLAREGQIDAIVGAFKDDAPDFLFPTEHLLSISPSSLFTLSDSSWQFDDLSSLDSQVLGVVTGYDYGEKMNRYIAARSELNDESLLSLFGNNVVSRNIDLLRNGRVDVIVASNVIFWYQTHKAGDAYRFIEVTQVQPEEPVYIAFSPAIEDGTSVIKDFDNGVRRMKSMQQVAKIANKYRIASKGSSP